MARSLILSNNQMLIALDERGQVEDLYFPHVGLENHMSRESVHRIGVFVAEKMSWLSEPQWEISVECERFSFASSVHAKNKTLGVELDFVDVVYNEKNIVIRNVAVTNRSDSKRSIKVFFAQEFELAESRAADTAYYDPRPRAIIHYKGSRAILVNAFTEKGQFTEYTIGEFKRHGKEGSYKDAENGILEQNPIEHGRVDSVIAVSLELEGDSTEEVFYWLCCGKSIEETLKLNRYVATKNPAYLINTTRDYWYAWVHKFHFILKDLSEGVTDLFRQSLFVVQGAADQDGSILASADSSMLQGGKDTYSYMWPRDGAFAAMALDATGNVSTAKRFFEFCATALSDEGYLMHKFNPDGSLGSSWQPWIRNGEPRLPIQEDETALPLIALKRHYERTHDIGFIEKIYNTLIKKAANFLAEYRYENGLPYPSFDLWEEKYGVHTYTAATVCAALRAASEFAGILGKQTDVKRWAGAAEEIRGAILEHLYDEELGGFYKSIDFTEDEKNIDRTIDASSLFGIAYFGILDINDPRLKKTIQTTRNALEIKTDIGGISRYEGDRYYRADPETPGNPWILTTLWFAQIELLSAKKEKDLEGVKATLEWCVSQAYSSYMLSEQIDPHTGKPLSATPLTWSHAEFLITVTNYLDKLEELGVCEECNPLNKKYH